MRLLAFSDLHHSRLPARAIVEASGEADLVIGAGDFCNHREGLDAALSLLRDLAAPMIAVPGNAESEAELRDTALPGTTVLHGSGTTIQGTTTGGLTIFGLGYAVPVTPFGDWSCDLTEAEAAAALDTCTACDILVCHSPPKGIADTTSDGRSIGSTSILAAAERLQPRLLLCGHVHDSWGKRGTIGATTVVNLGPHPTFFDL